VHGRDVTERVKPPQPVVPAGVQGDAAADKAESASEEADTEDPGIVPIEDSIDLHGFQPRDIPSVVEEYTRAAAERGFGEVRLIHGRGVGFQRHRVRQVLAACPWVERFTDAPATRGGWGATVVWLRPLLEGE
jgi:dsDNA-specific endonuclease/ATPase MutS2